MEYSLGWIQGLKFHDFVTFLQSIFTKEAFKLTLPVSGFTTLFYLLNEKDNTQKLDNFWNSCTTPTPPLKSESMWILLPLILFHSLRIIF